MISPTHLEHLRECTICKKRKPLDEFHRNKNYPAGHINQCKPCRMKQIKKWRKENPDKVRATNQRYYKTDKAKAMWRRERIKFADRRKKYLEGWRLRNQDRLEFHALNRRLKQRNMTREHYDALVKKQNNLCAVCEEPERRGEQLAIDHCHKTNQNRGLLCERHNMMMGLADDSPELLRKAAAYLEEYAVESGIKIGEREEKQTWVNSE